jgi:hypothetical protein
MPSRHETVRCIGPPSATRITGAECNRTPIVRPAALAREAASATAYAYACKNRPACRNAMVWPIAAG